MTHPFALSIDDLACIELLDETMPIEGGTHVDKRPKFPSSIVSHGNFEAGGRPGLIISSTHENGFTATAHEAGGFPPFVSTNVYPEHGGPLPVSQIHSEHGGAYLN